MKYSRFVTTICFHPKMVLLNSYFLTKLNIKDCVVGQMKLLNIKESVNIKTLPQLTSPTVNRRGALVFLGAPVALGGKTPSWAFT